jgi:hypothetical protein
VPHNGKYSTDKILSAKDNSFSRMVIDRNGIKWLGTNRDGVIFDDNGTILKNRGPDTETTHF